MRPAHSRDGGQPAGTAVTVIPFPGHHWAHCTRTHCTGCHLCHGGIAICTTCNGMEGSLTTDCPGSRVTREQDEAVYAGELDYRRGEGWVSASSHHSPAHYRT